jgi:5-methylcytosine-specific restriction endonuclease McrA
MQVLLLNASFVPLRPISVRRAVNLMLAGKVEAVGGVAAQLRTPRTIFEVPAVLRLRYYVNVPRRGATWSRRGVLERDHWTCVYCGARPGDRQRGRTLFKRDFSVDHIVPRSRGGKNSWTNTACACQVCNRRKADRTAHEAGLKLRFAPKTPRTDYVVASGEVPVAWRHYFEVEGVL